MKILLVSTLAVAFAAAPAFAQQPPTAPETAQGQIIVQGAEPSAVETTATVDIATPQPSTDVTVETEVTETPTVTVETRTEIAAPASDRPALDPANPRAPEVQAIVETKKNYTTADIVKAQHEAMLATPVSQPTTITTTTTTTEKSGG
ncbi:MAG TPA: hypothetical protein PLN33_06345 [Hyphomonadaceae bacterium]|nr:hypothetical protein [Hyphomonadaceae bacterium]HPN05155.1 hypothetical protein [Hyphomonadaceae bacterium]